MTCVHVVLDDGISGQERSGEVNGKGSQNRSGRTSERRVLSFLIFPIQRQHYSLHPSSDAEKEIVARMTRDCTGYSV
jgi:hypothetical protein